MTRATAAPALAGMIACLLAGVVAFLLAACESTQDRSERVGREGKGSISREKGVVVRHQTKRVEIVRTRLLQDQNGTAAVVEMRNATNRPLARLPVTIDVKGKAGQSLFRNDAPGLEASLAGASVLRPRARLLWVNDQVPATEGARSVVARVGDPRAPSPKRVPPISLSRPRLVGDPVSGIAAEGFAANRSKLEQRKLVIFAVARRGGRIVAAGRGQVNRLKPGKRARYQIFFIGNPRGASLTLAAPATQLD